MEISSVELRNVLLCIAKRLQGYYVNNIYAVSSSILLRFHHPTLAETQVVISPPRGMWVTKYEHHGTSAGNLVKTLRAHLGRARFVSTLQPPGERIAILEFEGPNGSTKIVGEFFGGGNIVLIDAAEKIIACQRSIRVRHRRIVVGEKYALPPTKGVDFFHITFNDLMKAKESNLEISRWLGREISLSRKYVEEILARAGVEKSAKCSALSQTDFEKIYASCVGIAGALSNADIRGLVILDESKPVDFAPVGFVTLGGRKLIEKDSLAEAVDEALSFDLKGEQETSAKKPQLKKLEELEKSLQEQTRIRQDSILVAAKLRDAANSIIQQWATKPVNIDTIQIGLYSDAVKVVRKIGKVLLKFGEDSLEFEEGMTGMRISSKLFDEAKRLESRAKLIEQARAKLAEQKASIVLQVQKDREEKLVTRPEPLWFERYRWLKTSEGLLAIGGRDAHSNTAIIRKHLSTNDIVLHAEIIGSPFFVIKNASDYNMQSINEVAKAVASFSRAWREGIKAADAFWVKPDQVRLQAPSGMFLQRGSFLIEGKKNYIKSIKLELAVGACRIEGRDTLMSGPLEAVANACMAYVVIVPENFKASETAKKVKTEIISLLDEDVGRIFKHVPLDDFVRVLPSGGGRIVSKHRGGENIKRF